VDPLHINQWWIVGIIDHRLVVVEELQGRPGRGGGSIIEPKRQELHRIIESWD
jgi:hypothetical protein